MCSPQPQPPATTTATDNTQRNKLDDNDMQD